MKPAALWRWLDSGGWEQPSSLGVRWVIGAAPAWILLASLDRTVPAWLRGAADRLVIVSLAILMLQALLRVRHGGRLTSVLKRRPLRLLFLSSQMLALGAGALGRLPLGATAVVLLGTDLLIRGFGTLTRGGRRSPPAATVLAISFLILIAGGTLVLLFPEVTVGPPLTLREALFTATSAVCVTGLSVIDVGTRLSPFGQGVLLVLIQMGGLGLMSLGAFLLLLMNKAHQARGAAVIGGLLGSRGARAVLRMAAAIFVFTLIIEALGALVLGWMFDDPWTGVFCSVSAFCNAGFFPDARSLVPYAGHVGVNLVVMLLVVLGGLGFPVVLDLAGRVRERLRGESRTRLTLATRVVLATSCVLIVVGALGFYVLESERSMAHLGAGDKVMASMFQSVTTRTAGFATVDFASSGNQAMHPATLTLATGLMSVGASPLSMGGGFKTLTLAVLIVSVVAVIRGRGQVNVAGRRILPEIIQKAAVVFVIYVVVAFLVVVALLLTDGHRFRMIDLIFEGVSALGTVGLSTGVTNLLSSEGQVVLCVAMYLGRIGPLTVFLLFSTTRSGTVEYPHENLVVG